MHKYVQLFLFFLAGVSIVSCSSDSVTGQIEPSQLTIDIKRIKTAAGGDDTKGGANTKLVLSWAPVGAVQNYKVYWAKEKGVTKSNYLGLRTVNEPRLELTGEDLDLMDRYYFVYTFWREGEESAISKELESMLVNVVESNGRTWIDRNLGATQLCTEKTDVNCYGNLFQWGRGPDGHELCINSNSAQNGGNTCASGSATTETQAAHTSPGHGDFVVTHDDWLNHNDNNLWVGGRTNNPCPGNFRVPIDTEWEVEIKSWASEDDAGAFASVLKLPVTGYREHGTGGTVNDVGVIGNYWSTTLATETTARSLKITDSTAGISSFTRASGLAVRCILTPADSPDDE